MSDWNTYWNELLTNNKLYSITQSIDQVLSTRTDAVLIEQICKDIANHYDNNWQPHLKNIKREFSNQIEGLSGIHLLSARVKDKSSLLIKVITKLYANINATDSKYYGINASNYASIITDLIGVRFIINYRGHWQTLHDEIINMFPLQSYDSASLPLEHVLGSAFLAEPPKVYYASGDCITQYNTRQLSAELHQKGYRGIHYIISYDDVYIELQVRTIYDEAWSECDHNYVYKHDAHPNHAALSQLSAILCSFTNIANDVSDKIRDIYESNELSGSVEVNWEASTDTIDFFDLQIKKIENALYSLINFKNRLQPPQ